MRETEKTLRGGRFSVALLLSAAMAFGGTPAVAIAEGVEAEDAKSITLDGDQTSSVSVPYSNEEYTDVLVNGSINVISNASNGASIVNNGQGSDDLKLVVNGSVNVNNESNSAQAKARGIQVAQSNSGESLVEVGGSVKGQVTGDKSTGYGMSITTKGGTANVTVDNDSIGENTGNNGTGFGVHIVNHDGGETNVTVGNDALGKSSGNEGEGTGVYIDARGGEASVTVGNDVTGEGAGQGRSAGVYINARGGKANVTVAGTVKGGTNSLWVIGDNQESVTINVWQVEGSIKASDAVKDNINYLVKANGGGQENYSSLGISNLKGIGGAVPVGEVSYDTAKAGSTLNFTVTAPAGKKVKAVYGYYPLATGGVGAEAALEALTPNPDGSYSLKVFEGGGINLFVEYEDDVKPEEKKDDTTTEEKKDDTTTEEKKDEAKPEEAKPEEAAADAEQVHLAATGAYAKEAPALPATGDAASLVPAAMAAIAGAGAIAAGRRGRRE